MTTSLGLLGKLTTSTEDISAIFTGQLHVPPFVLRLVHSYLHWSTTCASLCVETSTCSMQLITVLLLLLQHAVDHCVVVVVVTLLLLWVDGVVVCFLYVYTQHASFQP
jgi:hypothetical protein